MASINYDYLEDAELYNSGLIEEKMLEMYKKVLNRISMIWGIFILQLM